MLSTIAEQLKAYARAVPGTVARKKLRGGLHLSLVLEANRWRFTCYRFEAEPSRQEIETWLRDFGAPDRLRAQRGERFDQDGFKGFRFHWSAYQQTKLTVALGENP
jgi:hypothetical protein